MKTCSILTKLLNFEKYFWSENHILIKIKSYIIQNTYISYKLPIKRFGSVRFFLFFFKEIDIFFEQGGIELIKNLSKDI